MAEQRVGIPDFGVADPNQPTGNKTAKNTEREKVGLMLMEHRQTGHAISFGPRQLGWITFRRHGIRGNCRRVSRGGERNPDIERAGQTELVSLYFSFQARLALLRETGEIHSAGTACVRGRYMPVFKASRRLARH